MPKIVDLRLVLAMVAALGLGAPAQNSALARTAERLAVPGTSVSMIPPIGFAPATGFNGFQNAAGASILVSELPKLATPDLSRVFRTLRSAAKAMAARDVTLTRAVALDSGDAQAAYKPRVYAGTQDLNGVTYQKWLSTFRGSKYVIVSFQAPPGAELSDVVLTQTFASIRLSGRP